MRVVADTNVVVSGLLWHGSPRRVMEAARVGAIEMFSSVVLLAELEDVLHRPKFVQHLMLVGLTAHNLVLGYGALVTLVEPVQVGRVIVDDPDDDAVLECAVAAQADVIVSGDSHLLRVGAYEDIPILSAYELVSQLGSGRSLP
jgi:putative PIN family toxin of toxin-antitoxin system